MAKNGCTSGHVMCPEMPEGNDKNGRAVDIQRQQVHAGVESG